MSIPYSFNPLGSNPSSSISGMYLDGTALKGQLFNSYLAASVGEGADGSNLTDGDHMFNRWSNLTSFNVNLPNLTNGNYMFYNCTNLASFSANLPNLTNGNYMFYNCPKLKSFNANLPNLTNGDSMFWGCYLDAKSVLCILNSIPTYTSGTYKLNIGRRMNYLNSADIAALLGTTAPIAVGTYSYKGWVITVS